MTRKSKETKKRDEAVISVVALRLSSLSKTKCPPIGAPEIEEALDDLCRSKAYGFREVVLTCLVAWEIGIDFDPVQADFYDCHPRALYEQGIRHALDEREIPRMKSGPLNVAKGINKLDEDWTRGRRPEYAAKAAVKILKWINSAPSAEDKRQRWRQALDRLLMRLLDEKERLQSYDAEARTGLTLGDSACMLRSFIEEAPDAGNTPQVIVSEILAQLYESSACTAYSGGKACETNLTAKKPADIWIENENGQITHMYEVTVKPIDKNRIQDSMTSIIAHGKGHDEVVWLCRMPKDIEPLGIRPGEPLHSKGIRCEFVDLFEWLFMALELVGAEGRQQVLDSIAGYVAQPQTSETAKKKWKELQERFDKD